MQSLDFETAARTNTTFSPEGTTASAEPTGPGIRGPACQREGAGVMLIRRLSVPLLMLLCSFPCRARESKKLHACLAKANTQLAMQICASQEAARVNARMKALYCELLSKAAAQPRAVEKVKAAQATWISYRKAYIEAMFPAKNKQAEYGSIFPMEANLLYAALTRKHIADLQRLLRQYSR